MITHLNKPAFFIACSLVFSTAAIAGGIERGSSAPVAPVAPASATPVASSPAPAATPARAAASAATLTTPTNYTRTVWVSRSCVRPAQ